MSRISIPECRSALVVAAALALPGCGVIQGWFGDDSPGQRVPAPLVALEQERLTLQPLWSVTLDADDTDSISPPVPYLEEEVLFAAESEGAVLALDPQTGAVRWRTPVPGKALGSVAADGDRVYVGTQEQIVYALSRDAGAILWQQSLSSEIISLSALPGGYLAVRTNNARLYLLAAETGETLWEAERASPLLTMRGMSAPLAWKDHMLVGHDDGKLVSYEVESGRKLWETRLAFPVGRLELEQVVDIDGAILMHEDTAYVPVFNRLLAAVGAETGAVLWTQDIRLGHGAATDGVVMALTDTDGQVWALNTRDGGVYWRVYDLLYRGLSAPALAGLHAVVGDFEGYLHWLRIVDGKIEGRQKLGAPLHAAPLVQGDRIYLLDVEGRLGAYRYVLAPYTAQTQAAESSSETQSAGTQPE